MKPQVKALVGGSAALAIVIAATRFFGVLGLFGALLVLVLAVGVLQGLGLLGGAERRVEVRRSFWIGLLMPFGLGLLFVAERVIGEGHAQLGWWRGLALVCLAAALAWRGYELSRSTGNRRKVELRLMIAAAGVGIGLLLYAASTEAGLDAMGLEGASRERASGALSALWPALTLVSFAALFFMEMAYRVMPVDEAIELRRVDAAAGTGLTLALALVFAASINYVATERDVRRDLSYFKTTEPSETTLRMVTDLDEPIQVVLVYPRVNEVLDQLRPYFDRLDAASEQLTVEVRDHALSPDLARQHQVPRNGVVVLLRGEGDAQQAEKIEIGLELEQARRPLRRLDGSFQQHFAQLTTRPRDLHLTAGHREHTATGAAGDPAEQRLSELVDALARANIQSRDLGLAQGLANEVPEDARAVAIVGPRQPFLPEEADALKRYVGNGGRLAIFVDPHEEHGLAPLLAGLGLTLRDGVLHSEQSHLRRGPPPADRQVVYSNTYGAHPTVTTANRNRARLASVFDAGGALDRREGPEALPGLSVTFPIRTGDGFWLDQDGDHERDEGEPSDPRFHMMAAVTVANAGGEEGRAVVIADGDFITDGYIGNPGNAFVLMDLLNWLVGEDRVLGPTETEEDIPIEHTREEDKAWFYGTSFGAPLPLLLIGVWLAMRRFGGGRKERKSPRAASAVVAAETRAETETDRGPSSPSRREGVGGRAGEESESDSESDDESDDESEAEPSSPSLGEGVGGTGEDSESDDDDDEDADAKPSPPKGGES